MTEDATPTTTTEEATPTPSTITDLEAKIIKQLEYYFGDMNYTRDKFLQGKAKENEGWIDLKVLLTFNRLKELSADGAVITAAISKSTTDLIEVNDRGDGTVLMKRAAPIVSDDLSFWTEVRARSVYVKGFSTEASISDIEKVLGEFGTLRNVVMRRTRAEDRQFKGSVFACYASKDDCKKLLEADVKNAEGELLVKQWQEEHYNEKVAFRKELREKVRAEKALAGGGKPDKRVKEAPAIKFEPGLIAHLSGLAEKTNFVSIKAAIGLTKIAYVEHKEGEKEATIRLRPLKVDADKGDADKAKTDDKDGAKTVDKVDENGANGANDEKKVDENGAKEEKTAEENGVKEEKVVEETKSEESKGEAKPSPDETPKQESTPMETKPAVDAVPYGETLLKSLEVDGKLMIDDAEIAWKLVTGADETAYYERLREQTQNAEANRRGGGRGGRGGGRGRGGRGGGRGRGGHDNGVDARAHKRKQADAAQEGTEAKVAKPQGTHTKFDEGADA